MMRFSRSALRGHVEPLFAVASFGASSVFWMGLAFVMPVADYGRMMTLQAGIFLAVTFFTTRTHDLFFYLLSQKSVEASTAFHTAFKFEVLTGVLTVSTASLVASIMATFGATTQPVGAVAAISALQAVGAAQGASIGRLRQLGQGRVIAFADLLTLGSWLGVGAAALLVQEKNPILVLALSTIPTVARTIVLAGRAVRLNNERASLAEPVVRTQDIVRFLAAGQVANFFKNGAVSIETMILAAFTSPAVVALYRLARAMQGAPVAAMNIYYQRSFPSLAKAPDEAQRRRTASDLQRRCVIVCLAMYPLAASIAAIYAYVKPDVPSALFQLIVAGTTIGLLPIAVQQGAFARLAVAGRHHSVSSAYIVSAVVLLAISATLIVVPSVVLFLAAVAVSGIARTRMLSRAAEKLANGPTTGSTSHP